MPRIPEVTSRDRCDAGGPEPCRKEVPGAVSKSSLPTNGCGGADEAGNFRCHRRHWLCSLPAAGAAWLLRESCPELVTSRDTFNDFFVHLEDLGAAATAAD